jgi:hypothetical protein
MPSATPAIDRSVKWPTCISCRGKHAPDRCAAGTAFGWCCRCAGTAIPVRARTAVPTVPRSITPTANRRPRDAEKAPSGILQTPAEPDLMTAPNNSRCQATGQTPAVQTHRDPHQMVQTLTCRGWDANRGEGSSTAAVFRSGEYRHNVPAPRDVDRWTTSRNGVGSHARVDPWGDPGAYTAGPTRHPQRVRVRRAPADRSRSDRSVGRTRESCRRIPPWCARNGAHGGSADVRTSDRREPLPTPERASELASLSGPILQNACSGVGAPCPNAPIEMCPHER